jgi:hypothetical protein
MNMIENVVVWMLTPGVDQAFYWVIGGLLFLFVTLEIRAHYVCRRPGKEV